MPTFDIELEEPCHCFTVADYGSRTQVKFCVLGCLRNLMRQDCAIAEHWRHDGAKRWHLATYCHACDGHGAIPTEFGREILEFVARLAGVK